MTYSFEDARRYSEGTEIETDLCIVGAGAAGITIAQQFVGTSIRVCLIEAGGLNIDPDVDAASDVAAIGRDYPVSKNRLRYFGGTTNHWGGHCVPLEPADFEARSWIPHSGWPIGFADLQEYFRRSYSVLEIGDPDTTPEEVSAELGLPFIDWQTKRVYTQLSRYNRKRFGLAYGDSLDSAENVRVILYADASEFRLSDGTTGIVSSLSAISPSGLPFKIRAKHFVLASGGIENARTLLMSNRDRPAGLGNQSDALGRYFMEHLWYSSGTIVPFDSRNVHRIYSEEVPFRNYAVRGHLVLAPEESEAAEIGRFRAEISTGSELMDSMRVLAGGAITGEDVLRVAGQPYWIGHALACRGESRRDYWRLNNYIEQVPNPNSRVSLAPTRDAYGRPQAQLDWRLSPIDHQTVVRAHRLLAAEAGATSFGRMKIDIPESAAVLLDGASGGNHHMGTTRMSASALDGVVDENSRVFGTDNLFVAGSSVFPTAGYANPTQTIVALALRLSDHIKTHYAE
jgi:choline dehydrogenase-like flavoprotein